MAGRLPTHRPNSRRHLNMIQSSLDSDQRGKPSRSWPGLHGKKQVEGEEVDGECMLSTSPAAEKTSRLSGGRDERARREDDPILRRPKGGSSKRTDTGRRWSKRAVVPEVSVRVLISSPVPHNRPASREVYTARRYTGRGQVSSLDLELPELSQPKEKVRRRRDLVSP